MHSVNVFAQHKILYDTLTRLSGDEQAALDRAMLGGGWSKDVNGNLLSGLQALPLPQGGQTTATLDLAFDWPDSATRTLAMGVAHPQLLVSEVHGASPRGDLWLHQLGLASDVEGQPLVMYAGVPRPLVTEVQRQLRAAIRSESPVVSAYRPVPLGETVRVLEAQVVTRQRDRRVTKVKTLDVYDLHLEQAGGISRCQAARRAGLREDGAPLPVLGGSGMRALVLHALTGVPAAPFAVVDGQTPPTPPASAEQLLGRLTTTPPPPVSKPKPQPAPPPRPRTPTPPSRPEAAPRAPEPEPEAVAPPPPPPPPADPWLTLPERMAVEPGIVEVARKTLERHRPLLLTGSPGVGKTLLATLLAEALCGEGNYTLVTADARWTSSEVLGGLRVVPGDSLRYAFMPGVVTRAAQRHAQSMQATGRPHALIVDEFNRAHQDEAFGRLLTLLDARYRTQLPLVGPDDGAPEEVFLPADFLLIGTLNDADTARLHDLSAALQRRFTTVHLEVPASERTHLERMYAEIPQVTFDALYGVVGTSGPQDRAEGRLRSHVTVGTHFMSEVLEYVRAGMTLDASLSTLAASHLSHLTRVDLERLAERAAEHRLQGLRAQLEKAVSVTAF
ncbi:AAA family ATPase [Deinococcus budaensis]|uniref:MoxR-like ATPase n=1 Tax=Deinococcus budaensis TaxID=1665626 RepID=A0A7W8GH67_9DEIO|nr:AAA family ATPase [Deinococcus budaensis]MBB5235571.1 MoxR-like ATPase [Deinococcus budaensis]